MDMDKNVYALQKLCERFGSHVKVAEAAGVHPHSLYQIISGVKLPSGRPKGVGPKLRRQLDEAFPGWSKELEPGEAFQAMTTEEYVLLENFRRLTDQDRERYVKEIADRARELTDYLDKHLKPLMKRANHTQGG